MRSPQVRIGLENCLEDPPASIQSGRFGLLMNQASVDAGFHYAHHLLAERFPGRLAAIFSPQHGLFGEQQDNMIESPHGRNSKLRVPIHSLYSATRRPLPEMLTDIDTLVIDLQDVGCRVYTFIWTMLNCMEECAQAGVRVVVLDRPNPLGGELVEGPRLDEEFRSFVGLAPIPMRHGLTIGELARHFKRTRAIDMELDVVPMTDYSLSIKFRDTGRVWVPTSPNLARLEGVDVYPGQVLLEGTNLSEGRGTTTPFEICGAPFIDPDRLVDRLGRYELPGVVFRPIRFEPTFQKWAKQSCGGLFIHVVVWEGFRPYRTTVAILAAVKELWPESFAWRPPPYEYEETKMPIDILSGSPRLRETLDRGGVSTETILALSDDHGSHWFDDVRVDRIYA